MTTKSHRLAPRFQEAVEARQGVAGSQSLQEAPGRPLHRAVRVKAKWQWRFQEVVAEGTIGCPLRKAVGREEPTQERGCICYRQQS